MKLRQKLAAFMAAMILATALPTFAASTNGVNKIITVAKETSLDVVMAPQLKIELKDKLTSGQAFYLALENAEWDQDITKKLNEDKNFVYTLSSNSEKLEVKAKRDLAASPKAYTIPMLTKVMVGDATVIVDSNDTVVTGGKYVFAISNDKVLDKAIFVIGQTTYTTNGVEKTMDTAAYLAKEGRTMLPVRYVADALGVQPQDILWDSTAKTVTILADRVVQIKLGRKEMVINGAVVPMTAAAEIKNNRVFIPVAEVARALSANVAWDEKSKTATFN